MAVSVPVILEYKSVLLKNNRLLGLSEKDVSDFLDYICKIGNQSKIYYLWRPILKDPFYDHILEIAVASNSRYIVTHNKKDFLRSGQFNILPVTPREYLEIRRFV